MGAPFPQREWSYLLNKSISTEPKEVE